MFCLSLVTVSNVYLSYLSSSVYNHKQKDFHVVLNCNKKKRLYNEIASFYLPTRNVFLCLLVCFSPIKTIKTIVSVITNCYLLPTSLPVSTALFSLFNIAACTLPKYGVSFPCFTLYPIFLNCLR